MFAVSWIQLCTAASWVLKKEQYSTVSTLMNPSEWIIHWCLSHWWKVVNKTQKNGFNPSRSGTIQYIEVEIGRVLPRNLTPCSMLFVCGRDSFSAVQYYSSVMIQCTTVLPALLTVARCCEQNSKTNRWTCCIKSFTKLPPKIHFCGLGKGSPDKWFQSFKIRYNTVHWGRDW